MAIAKDRIVAEALKLLDEVGIDALSTRKLAERLGVQQPALYWHFRNKRALLDAMDEAMLAPHVATSMPRADDDWRSFMVRYCTGLRRGLLSYRQGAAVHAGAPPSADDAARLTGRLNFLKAQGFSGQLAMETVLSAHHYVLGSVNDQQADQEAGIGWDKLHESSGDIEPDLIAIAQLGRDHVFDTGLAMLLDGVALRLGGLAQKN